MVYIHRLEKFMQDKPRRIPASCYCLKIRKASAAVTKLYDNILEPCGVTVRQYSLLFNISYRSNHCSVKELADMAELDRSTLARSLKPLFLQGLIVDTSRPGTRNSQLELTEAGKETLERAKILWSNAQLALMQKFGDEGLAALEKVLRLLEVL
jgi:DNA-binding MarR family transcriptional regulator